MALKEYITDNGQKIPLDWATEETLHNIFVLLRNQTNKKSQDQRQETRVKKENQEETKKHTKTLKDSNYQIDKLKKNYGRLSQKAAHVAEEFTRVDESAKGITSKFLKLAGITGIIGTGLGFLAGVVDTVAKTQQDLSNSGFLLGSSFLDVSNKLLEAGVGIDDFSSIISSSGQNIRFLGETSLQSAMIFGDSIKQIRRDSEQFGYFGMTMAELTGEFADYNSIFIQAGISREKINENTKDHFIRLNQELLGYTRITGRQRRDALRAEQELKANTLLVERVGQDLGNTGVAAIDALVKKAEIGFGESGQFISGILLKEIQAQLTGIQAVFTQEELATLSATKLKAPLQEFAREFITRSRNEDPTGATTSIDSIFKQFLVSIDENKRPLLRLAEIQQFAGGQLADMLRNIIKLRQDGQQLAANSGKDLSDTVDQNKRISREDQAAKAFRNNIKTSMRNIQAMLLSIVFNTENGMANLPGLMAEIDFNNFNEHVKRFGERIKGVKGGFGIDDPDSIAGVLASIGTLFGAPAVIAGLVGSISGLFLGKLALGAMTGGIGLLFRKAIPTLGKIISGGRGNILRAGASASTVASAATAAGQASPVAAKGQTVKGGSANFRYMDDNFDAALRGEQKRLATLFASNVGAKGKSTKLPPYIVDTMDWKNAVEKHNKRLQAQFSGSIPDIETKSPKSFVADEIDYKNAIEDAKRRSSASVAKYADNIESERMIVNAAEKKAKKVSGKIAAKIASKAIPIVGLTAGPIIDAALGYWDEEYQAAGLSAGDRMAAGFIEGWIATADLMAGSIDEMSASDVKKLGDSLPESMRNKYNFEQLHRKAIEYEKNNKVRKHEPWAPEFRKNLIEGFKANKNRAMPIDSETGWTGAAVGNSDPIQKSVESLGDDIGQAYRMSTNELVEVKKSIEKSNGLLRRMLDSLEKAFD